MSFPQALLRQQLIPPAVRRRRPAWLKTDGDEEAAVFTPPPAEARPRRAVVAVPGAVASPLGDAVAGPPVNAIRIPAPVGRPVRVADDGSDPLPDRASQLNYRIAENQNRPPKIGRGRAFLLAALDRLGAYSNQALQAAAARGERPDAGDVFSALAAGAGAGAVGAIAPEVVGQGLQEREHGRLSGELDAELDRRARTAQVEQLTAAPRVALERLRQQQTQAEREALEYAVSRTVDAIKMEGRYRRGEDPERDRLLDAARVRLRDFEREDKDKNPIVREVNGRSYQWDAGSKAWVEARGLPAEERVVVEGLSVPPVAALNYRGQVAQREQQQQNRVEDRATTDARYGFEHEERDVERQRNDWQQERGRADTLAQRFEDRKADALAADAERRQWEATAATLTDADDKAKALANAAAARARHDASANEARGLASQLSHSYGAHYEVGADQGGNPYVKPRPAPAFSPRRSAPAPQRSRAQGSPRYTEEQVRERARTSGATAEQIEAAVRLARQRGWLR